MSEFKENAFILDKRFDPMSKRHFINGFVTVLHCHHYSTLYTQLALDAKETDLLADVAQDVFYQVLSSYFEDFDTDSLDEMIDLCCQYYAAVGLGKMKVNFAGEFSGEVELEKSHLDSGWLKKFGTYDRPINYIAAGFISAMFAVLFDEAPKTYKADEIQSIVMGADKSVFKVYKAL